VPLHSYIGKIVRFRTRWNNSDKVFYGIVVSVTTPTESAHRNYAFVRDSTDRPPRPVYINRLELVRNVIQGRVA